MKRKELLRKIRAAAKERGLPFEIMELTRHTGVLVGSTRSTIGRHNEVDEVTAALFSQAI